MMINPEDEDARHSSAGATTGQHIVYIIENQGAHGAYYVGLTNDLSRRLQAHNRGDVRSTRGTGPWNCIFYASFKEKKVAIEFEKYLKSHSGRAFMHKRLL